MRIWLPYADWPQLLNLPEGMQADVFEGFGDTAGQHRRRSSCS